MEAFDQVISPYGAQLLILAAGLSIFVAVLLRIARAGRRPALLERKPLMTQPEKKFYRLLRSAYPDADIAPQVAMGALLKPRKGLSRKGWFAARSQIGQKIVDFAIVDPASGEVLAVVELDDKSHDAKRDAVRDRHLGQGGYRVARFMANKAIEPNEIRAKIGVAPKGGA